MAQQVIKVFSTQARQHEFDPLEPNENLMWWLTSVILALLLLDERWKQENCLEVSLASTPEIQSGRSKIDPTSPK